MRNIKKKVAAWACFMAIVCNVITPTVAEAAPVTSYPQLKIKKLYSAPGNSIKIFCDNVADSDMKYQVIYATNKKFVHAKKKSARFEGDLGGYFAYSIENLKPGKKYYLKIRVRDKRNCGRWSNVKSIKLKKEDFRTAASAVVSMNSRHKYRVLYIGTNINSDWIYKSEKEIMAFWSDISHYMNLEIRVLGIKGSMKATGENDSTYDSTYATYFFDCSKGSFGASPDELKKGMIRNYNQHDDLTFGGNGMISFKLPKGISSLKLKVSVQSKTGNKMIGLMRQLG